MDKELVERIALLRFGIIAPLVDPRLCRGERERREDQSSEASRLQRQSQYGLRRIRRMPFFADRLSLIVPC